MKQNINVRILESENKERNRIYPKKVLENAIYNTQSLITENKFFVYIKCPDVEFSSLIDIIGIVKKLTLKDDGIYADIQFLNTPSYQTFEKCIDNIPNINLNNSFSSLGLGTTKKKKGIDIVQSDFELTGVYFK